MALLLLFLICFLLFSNGYHCYVLGYTYIFLRFNICYDLCRVSRKMCSVFVVAESIGRTSKTKTILLTNATAILCLTLSMVSCVNIGSNRTDPTFQFVCYHRSSFEKNKGNKETQFFNILIAYLVGKLIKFMNLIVLLQPSGFNMDYINPNLCTHMIYVAAIVDAEEMTIQVRDFMTDVVNKSYDKFVALKEKNPNLKVMIAMGATKYGNNLAKLVANNTEFAGNIDKFVVSSVAFLKRFQFDGLHLEWQYSYQVPHQEGFSYLVAALRNTFRKHGYLLSATVTPLTWFVPKGINDFDIWNLKKKP